MSSQSQAPTASLAIPKREDGWEPGPRDIEMTPSGQHMWAMTPGGLLVVFRRKTKVCQARNLCGREHSWCIWPILRFLRARLSCRLSLRFWREERLLCLPTTRHHVQLVVKKTMWLLKLKMVSIRGFHENFLRESHLFWSALVFRRRKLFFVTGFGVSFGQSWGLGLFEAWKLSDELRRLLLTFRSDFSGDLQFYFIESWGFVRDLVREMSDWLF